MLDKKFYGNDCGFRKEQDDLFGDIENLLEKYRNQTKSLQYRQKSRSF